MKQALSTVFDELVVGKGQGPGRRQLTLTSSLVHTDVLSAADQLCFQVVADVLESAGPCPFEVYLEHSTDGRRWKVKGALPVVSAVIVPGLGARSFAGGEAWPTRPSQRFVRLRLQVGNGRATFAMRLAVHVVARSRRVGAPAHAVAAREGPLLAAAAALLGVGVGTLREAARLHESAAHLVGAARHEQLARALSPDGRAEIAALATRLRALDGSTKRLLLGSTQALAALLGAPRPEPPVSASSAHALIDLGGAPPDALGREPCLDCGGGRANGP